VRVFRPTRRDLAQLFTQVLGIEVPDAGVSRKGFSNFISALEGTNVSLYFSEAQKIRSRIGCENTRETQKLARKYVNDLVYNTDVFKTQVARKQGYQVVNLIYPMVFISPAMERIGSAFANSDTALWNSEDVVAPHVDLYTGLLETKN